MIIGIADGSHGDRSDERPAGRVAAAQARAVERVVLTLRRLRMEVHIEHISWISLALVVTDMLPLAADAWITQDLAAIHVAERRAQLPAMRDLLNRQTIG